MFTREFLEATFERLVKTFCQFLAVALTASGTGLIDTDWVGVLSMVGMGTLLSVLTSIGSSKFTSGDGPAAFGPEVIPEPGTPVGEGGAVSAPMIILIALAVLIFLMVAGVLDVNL